MLEKMREKAFEMANKKPGGELDNGASLALGGLIPGYVLLAEWFVSGISL